ncbi:SRPBCC family protein [Sphaerisporangium corydalis]|uniref:SRPBCC family protein n=1 Tax=Sphaerisporangium corydalis TaxID=1441875 RepID=A0ABV9E6T0_9ACTN|nr:SRPBCC family protein [Sphaerisporangium corydalis]
MRNFPRLVTARLVTGALALFGFPDAGGAPESDARLAAAWRDARDSHRFDENAAPPRKGRRRGRRDISIEISAPIEHVFRVYSDFGNHVGMHSFLKRMVVHQDRTEGGTRHIDFTAVEEIPVAGVPVVSSTHARQRVHHDAFSYETDTWSLPDVVTHQRIVFEDLGGGRTRVTEHLAFEAGVLFIGVTVGKGTAAHKETQAGLKTAIESGAL